MAGPTTSYPGLPDIQEDYDSGDVESGDVVYVESELFVLTPIPIKWVLVLDPIDPLSEEPQIIPLESPTVADYEGYTLDYAIYSGTPTLVPGTGTVVNDPECGAGPLSSGQLAVAVNTSTVEYESMDRGAGSGSEGEPFDSADLISTPSIT